MNYILEILPSLFTGAKTTLLVFGFSLLGSIPLGILVAFAMQIPFKPLTYLLNGYIWLMRGTPLLLQMIFVFFGLPAVGINLDRFPAVMIAFILNYAAYFAEIFRGGIQSVPKGQIESAKVLGLSPFQTAYKITLPQVIKIILPSVGNEVINLVKDSSLIYAIGLSDLLQAGKNATNRDVTLVPLFLVAVFYLFFTAILTTAINRVEKKLDYYE